jgi:hypothetical protein
LDEFEEFAKEVKALKKVVDLSELRLCEEDVELHPLTPKTVVFKGVWGQTAYVNKIAPMIGELATKVVSMGLREEGIAITFKTKRDASLVRLFYPGETLTA